MNIQQYIDMMKNIQNQVLKYIGNEDNSDESFNEITVFLENQKIQSDKHVFKSFLYLISNISNYHQRLASFNNKIDQILNFFSESIRYYFTNDEIFNIFKSNKRVLLFLIEHNLLTIDETIFLKIQDKEYLKKYYTQYFYPEIKHFIVNKKQNPMVDKDFYEKRRIGENDQYICEIIRNDNLEKFIEYFKENNIEFWNEIQPSIFETNQFLLQKKINFITYAAFFSSNQIIRFLLTQKGFTLCCSMWDCAVHCNSVELIQLLKEKNFSTSFSNVSMELIRSYSSMAKFIDTPEHKNSFELGLRYYNFNYIDINHINNTFFYQFCLYDYLFLVKILAKADDFNVNCLDISIIIFLNKNANSCYINTSSLYGAVLNDNYEIVQFLLTFNNININFINI